MVGGSDDGNRIVHSWSDRTCATGESYYQTEDGRVWKTHYGSQYPQTGVRFATIRNGRVENERAKGSRR